MGIGNVAGLLGLLALVPIIILYMLRPEREIELVPSNYLWQQMQEQLMAVKKISKLKKNLLLLLDILIVLFITALLLGLFINVDQESKEVVILLDGSMSMNANDIKPSRFARAQTEAIAYIDKLADDSMVSLIYLANQPELVYHQQSGKRVIKSGIKKLKPSYNEWQTADLKTFLNGLNLSENSQLIYFGDRNLSFAEVFLLKRDDNNLILKELTANQSQDELLVMATVDNRGSGAQTVEISLYNDKDYLETVAVEVAARSEAKVFFSPLPTGFTNLRAEIDNEDILALDNTRFLVRQGATIPKVAFISDGNFFVEKFLALKDFEVYKMSPKDYSQLDGFDLYIFDSFLPKNLPVDGNMLFLDPPSTIADLGVDVKGYVENPQFDKTEHSINKFTENSSFKLRSSWLYDVGAGKDTILKAMDGALALDFMKDRQRIVIFGFDFRYSDLPLDTQFPIYMNNIFTYLLSQKMTAENSYKLGQVVLINSLPTASEIKVIKPDKKQVLLNDSDNGVFKDANLLGIYKIEQAGKSAYFAVNPTVYDENDSGEIIKTATLSMQKKDINLVILVLLIIALIVELYLRLSRITLFKYNA